MADRRLRLDPGTPARLARLRLGLPYTPVLAEPRRRAAQLSEIVFGQDFDVHLQKGRWSYGRVRALLPGSRRSDYVGWVASSGLQEPSGTPSHAVSVLSAPVFHQPDLKRHIVMSLPLGARLDVLGENGAYLQIGSGAWVHRLHARPLREAEPSPVAVARRYLGQPYVWGGNGARGVDCSGLVQMTLTACGVDCPRDADQQEEALGESVPVAEILSGEGQPGDLLFWPGHVGLLATRKRLLHANAYHMAVVEEALAPALRRMAGAGTALRSARRL